MPASKTSPLPDESRTVRLRVLCTPLPPRAFDRFREIQLGMQYGKEEVRPGREESEGTLRFECEVRVKKRPDTGRPDFLGPWVHGAPGTRFLYLVWEGEEEGVWQLFRRMKVPLSPITWEQVEAAGGGEEGVLEGTVSGVGADGAPACASVPLADGGWTLRRG
jgi:hypothetical protein